ncbi:MAG TPA: energy transducer TonB [Candidatus Wallbacteria bacterium]|nr:energy transducer TonB [Candidatus Wallbacteria bacterium]
MRMNEYVGIKKTPSAINGNLFIIFLIYSITVHVSTVIACTGYFGKNFRAVALALDKKVKIPYAQTVSLTGRKGNSYDRSKINVKADLDKLKSFFSENLKGFKGYIEEKQNADLAKQALNKKIESRLIEKTNSDLDLKEKMTYASARVEKIVRAMKNYKPVEKPLSVNKNVSFKKAVSARKTVIENKGGKPGGSKKENIKKFVEAETEDFKAGNASATAFRSNGLKPDANMNEVFGNMSGNEIEGDGVAGAPHGEMDPSIEASKIDIFKSIVSEKIMGNLKYPERCRRFDIEGTARLKFEIRPGGMLDNVEITGSSGNDEIDGSALDAVKRAQPFIPFPAEIKKNITFSIPLVYKIRR